MATRKIPQHLLYENQKARYERLMPPGLRRPIPRPTGARAAIGGECEVKFVTGANCRAEREC
jgi:hypothetical protein